MVKSMMRKRIGLSCHFAKSSSFRIWSSTAEIVPKKTEVQVSYGSV